MGKDEKSMSIGSKLYGNPRFETGPARKKLHGFQNIEERGPKPSLESGTKLSGPALQKKYDGNAGRGVKGNDNSLSSDAKGEDYAGKADKDGSRKGKYGK